MALLVRGTLNATILGRSPVLHEESVRGPYLVRDVIGGVVLMSRKVVVILYLICFKGQGFLILIVLLHIILVTRARLSA